MRILVIEDDRLTAEFVQRALREDGYAVDIAADGSTGRVLALTEPYDALLVDLMLPDVNGFDLVQTIRNAGCATPILLLTAKKGSEFVVRGLNLGADDYVAKPFVVDELRARVNALVRRGGAQRPETLALGGLKLDRLTRTATSADKLLKLTPKEFRLLEHLMLNAGRMVTRTELLEKVWELHFDPGSNVVDAHVARLRAKLRAAGAGVRLLTVRGSGFMVSEATDQTVNL